MATKSVSLKPEVRPVVVPEALPPASKNPPEGMESARALARRYLPNGVLLWAGVAYSPSSEASLWVKVQCARLIAEVAGAIPQPVPESPGPLDGDADGQRNVPTL